MWMAAESMLGFILVSSAFGVVNLAFITSFFFFFFFLVENCGGRRVGSRGIVSGGWGGGVH